MGEAPLISSAICVTEDGKNSFFDRVLVLLLPLDGIPELLRCLSSHGTFVRGKKHKHLIPGSSCMTSLSLMFVIQIARTRLLQVIAPT